MKLQTNWVGWCNWPVTTVKGHLVSQHRQLFLEVVVNCQCGCCKWQFRFSSDNSDSAVDDANDVNNHCESSAWLSNCAYHRTRPASTSVVLIFVVVIVCCDVYACVCVCQFEVHFWSRSQLWQFGVCQWLITWRTWSRLRWPQRLDRYCLPVLFTACSSRRCGRWLE